MTDFQVRLVPGLTVQDTEFVAQGSWSRPNKGLGSSVEAGGAAIWWAEEQGWERPGDVTLWAAHATDVFTAAVGKPSVSLTPIALEHFVGDNRRGDPDGPPAKYSADLSTEVTDSSTSDWSHSESASVGFTVGVEIGFEGDKASASTSVSFDTTDGESHSTSHEVQVGTKVGVDLEAPGGTCLLAVLLLQRGTVTGSVHYTGRTTGTCLVGYKPGSPLYAPLKRPPVKVKIEDLRLPEVHSVQTLTRAFAADSQIVTADIPSDDPDDVSDGIERIVKGAEDSPRWMGLGALNSSLLAHLAARVPLAAGPARDGGDSRRDSDDVDVGVWRDPATGNVLPRLNVVSSADLTLPQAKRLWHDLGGLLRRLEDDGDPAS